MLEFLNELNRAFFPVLDLTLSYKPELGNALQNLVECYNIIALE
jgi:hypothetical protein